MMQDVKSVTIYGSTLGKRVKEVHLVNYAELLKLYAYGLASQSLTKLKIRTTCSMEPYQTVSRSVHSPKTTARVVKTLTTNEVDNRLKY